jgi:hypothetical protein
MRARRHRGGLVLIAVSVSATLVGTAGGDVIELKTGQRVDAKVLVVSPEAGVVVDQDGTKAIITLDQVRAIYFGSSAPATGSSSNLAAAHRAKAHLDARALETAVVNYTLTFGSLPQSLDALTRRSEIAGASGGPFIREVPTPPPGWSPYSYVRTPDGQFSITTAGDGTTVRVPAP